MYNTTFGSSSPIAFPSTPASSSRHQGLNLNLTHIPMHSSPLASPSTPTKSSPVVAAQARRRSQYKSTPSFSFSSSSSSSAAVASSSTRTLRSHSRNLNLNLSGGNGNGKVGGDEPQMRERFKARCFERALKAREGKVMGKRSGRGGSLSEASSDGFDVDVDMDGEADGEGEGEGDDLCRDELFVRILQKSTQKRAHTYRWSYEQEVGSSFDPNMEDVERWESEMKAPPTPTTTTTPHPVDPSDADLLDSLVDELDEEELQAYADEYGRQNNLSVGNVAEQDEEEEEEEEHLFEDLPDELINWDEVDAQGDVDMVL